MTSAELRGTSKPREACGTYTHVAVIMRQVQHTCKMSFGVTGTSRKKYIRVYSHQKLSSLSRLVVEHEIFPLEIGK